MGSVFSSFDDLICERRPAYVITFNEADTSTPEGYHDYAMTQLKRSDRKPNSQTQQIIPIKHFDNTSVESDNVYSGTLDIV